MAFPKGCLPPKDLGNRTRLSYARHGARFRQLLAAAPPPASFDCRAKGWVTPVKDQKQCGDCWNFAGTGIGEMASIIAGLGTKDTVNWSEQSVLDCGSNGGCNGDWPETALEQAKNSGIANTSSYPYEGGVDRCRNVPHSNLVSDYGYVGPTSDVPPPLDIKVAMLVHGPIAVAIAADNAFENNPAGTVFLGSGSTQIDHAVILVGWEDDSSISTDGFWILRNSWSPSWCEDGYCRIAYGANLVGYGAMWASCAAPVPPSPAPPIPPNPSPSPAPSPAPSPSPLSGSILVDFEKKQAFFPPDWTMGRTG